MEPEKCTLEERRVLYRLNPYEVLDYAVQVHEPGAHKAENGQKIRKVGTALLLSSSRNLNWANGELLANMGYETLTGIVVRDLEDTILPQYNEAFDILALSPPIHVEHHELEEFLEFRKKLVKFALETDKGCYGEWRLGNLKRIYEDVLARQSTAPVVFIDDSALKDSYQPDITEKGLHGIGIDGFCLFTASNITQLEF